LFCGSLREDRIVPGIETITGTGLPLLLDDIDTDRIIPARYLRAVTFDGLGEHAFEDDRRQDPQHPFDRPQHRGASILIVGRNFGCGSSREHAPQALIRWGIKAIVGESFAEIFFGNCTALGVPCVSATRGELEKLAAAIANDPNILITVDMMSAVVRAGQLSFGFTMPAEARNALVSGQYDFLSQLLEGVPQVRERAEKLPYLNNFT
jgi:3-isopropylmalate/(R)-2-methylmalate dehydratase small subunit